MKTRRIVLGLQYDGSNWQGWQTQPNGKTIQDMVEKAIFTFTKTTVQVFCAGRTDAGVHAIEQVIHFDTLLDREMYSWVNGVNTFLPPSIAIRWAKEIEIDDINAPNNFHARFSAFARTYHYIVYNNSVRSPLWHNRAGWCFHPLDLSRMRTAVQFLTGEKDFTVFRAAACQAKTPVKTMYDIQINQIGDQFIFSFRANAFLHHMIRNIVGSLIFVGASRKEPSWIAELIASKDRSLAAPTFMPDGLYLAKIDYDAKWRLPQNSLKNSLFDIFNQK